MERRPPSLAKVQSMLEFISFTRNYQLLWAVQKIISSKNSVTKFESSSDPLLLKLCKWTIAILNGVWGALNKMLKKI